MKYRAEIDGLRGLAVVPVILFHAGFELFSGGFVGVDVFFVISGYLITTILIEDIENKRFSIVNFYERRARRILPALFFVMLVCIPFAWMWMLPNQMKDFSQSLVAVSLFASNILFWKESGYFAAAAEEKPLLHTWSLAVEEQYYVLFPIFLILAWRFGKNRVFWMIVVMAAISLLLSEWGWRNKATANFYLAPTRAWELFAGSIAAFIVQKQSVRKNNLLAFAGLIAIIFSILFYDETTPFPSVYALLPVLGVVLLVLFADKETLAAKLLSTKVFVGIGLISYSAYLWHQPLFAFARIVSLEQPSLLLMSLLSLTCLILAFFSWRYIEKPFRYKHKLTTGKIFFISSSCLTFTIIFGLAGQLSGGFPSRHTETPHYQATLTPEKFNVECLDRFPEFEKHNTCRMSDFNEPTIALIGDSHSHALYESMTTLFPQETVINLGVWSCYPFVNYEHLERSNCDDNQSQLSNFLQSNPQIHTVVLAGYWGYLASGRFAEQGVGWRLHDNITDSDADSFLTNAADFLSNLEPHYRRVFLIEDVPDLDFSPISCGDIGMPRYGNAKCSMRLQDYLERKRQVEPIIDSLIIDFPRVSYVRTQNLFCDEAVCNALLNGETMYRDGDHLSKNGADLVIEALSRVVNE